MFRTERFRELKEKQRWGWKTLAEECGVEPATISNWANGRVKPKYIHAIALSKILDVNISELWDGEKD